MTYKVLLQATKVDMMFDISELVDEITYDTYIDGQPGKCSFNLMKDPTGALVVNNGSIIDFSVDGKGIFYGYVFEITTSDDGKNKIIAYDQLRYLKNEEYYVTNNQTASQMFEMICQDCLPQAKTAVIVPSVHVPKAKAHSGTLYQVMEYGINESNRIEKKKYFIRDNYGTLEFTEVAQLKTNYVLGDGVMVTGYSWGLSIDKSTFNYIKMKQTDEESNTVKTQLYYDSEKEKLWGKLQKVVEVDASLNAAEVRALGELYLDWYSFETQTMTLNAIGVDGLYAGSGFTVRIADISEPKAMWISTASHTYKQGMHTMKLTLDI